MMFEQDYENPYNTYNPYNTFTSPLWYPTWHVLITALKSIIAKKFLQKMKQKVKIVFISKTVHMFNFRIHSVYGLWHFLILRDN